jgi:hypothetical protein
MPLYLHGSEKGVHIDMKDAPLRQFLSHTDAQRPL